MVRPDPSVPEEARRRLIENIEWLKQLRAKSTNDAERKMLDGVIATQEAERRKVEKFQKDNDSPRG